EGMQEEYIRRHRAVWPEVLTEMQRAGITKLAIFMRGAELVLYMEVEDYARAIRLLNDSPESNRWEEYMSQIMEENAGKSFDPANAFPDSLPEVFFWEPAEPSSHARQLRAESANDMDLAAPHFVPTRSLPLRP